jgi:FMN phosphatase YigB (HAD superfamily)
MERPEAVIFDMDGTLADVSSIRHLVTGPDRNFHAFHRESINCPAHRWVVRRAHAEKAAGRSIIIMTARQQKYGRITGMWLALHDVPSDVMYMRRDNDGRPDYEIKKDLFTAASRRFRVRAAVDDNPNVLKLWNELGLDVTVVPGWPRGDTA